MKRHQITPAEEFNGSSSNPVKDDDEKSISFNFRIIGWAEINFGQNT